MSGGFSPNTNYINGGSTGSSGNGSTGNSSNSGSSTGGSNSGGITYIPPSGGSTGSGGNSSTGGNSSNSGGNSSTGGNSSNSGGNATIAQSIQANIGDEIQGALLSSVTLIGLLVVLIGIGLAWKYFKRTAQEKNTEYYSSRADYFRQLNRYWDRRRGD